MDEPLFAIILFSFIPVIPYCIYSTSVCHLRSHIAKKIFLWFCDKSTIKNSFHQIFGGFTRHFRYVIQRESVENAKGHRARHLGSLFRADEPVPSDSEKRTLTAILRMYHQQEEMYRSKTHTCAGWVLSIFQPVFYQHRSTLTCPLYLKKNPPLKDDGMGPNVFTTE